MPQLNTSSGLKEVVLKAPFAEVLRSPLNGQCRLSSTRPFRKGEVICRFKSGRRLSKPNYLTVQVGPGQHITLNPEYLQYLNHSCAPNAFLDTAAGALICLKKILPGEEITFFYPSTEWIMDQPFVCQCGTAECLQLIQGAAFLPRQVLDHYQLNSFIRELLLQKEPVETA